MGGFTALVAVEAEEEAVQVVAVVVVVVVVTVATAAVAEEAIEVAPLTFMQLQEMTMASYCCSCFGDKRLGLFVCFSTSAVSTIIDLSFCQRICLHFGN